MRRCVAVSKVPRALFDDASDRWLPLLQGRWRWREHITMGEARVSLRVMETVSAFPQAGGFIVAILEDNEPWSSATMKGRSPTFRVNSLLRRRCAHELATGIEFVQPWVDTRSQPADNLNREK